MALVALGTIAAGALLGCGNGGPAAAGGRDAEAEGARTDDETTGQTCDADSDCWADGGPHTNLCSRDPGFVQSIDGVNAQLWPAPVCLKPWPDAGTAGNCDPAPAATDSLGVLVHFCDGPDEPSSPGVCVPLDPSPQQGRGVCFPKCTFGLDASAGETCASPDGCVFLGYGFLSGNPAGFGYCQGGCQSDADCAALGAGYACQADLGVCTQTAIARTSDVGAPCGETDETSGACNCQLNPSTGKGYCTKVCVVGGSNGCDAGWVCETGQSASVSFVGGPVPYAVSGPAPGLLGFCAPSCDAGAIEAGAEGNADGGGAGDGQSTAEAGAPASACPGVSVCTSGGLGGADCIP
jgi:hypothetical protein